MGRTRIGAGYKYGAGLQMLAHMYADQQGDTESA